VVKAYPRSCKAPTTPSGSPYDGSRPQLFVELAIPGLTDQPKNTAGTAFVDLNHDGIVDVVLAQDDLNAFINDGCFYFEPHALAIDAPPAAAGVFNVPTFADFNHDGFLDVYLPSVGRAAQARFLLSRGSWDQFKDFAVPMGVANPGAYARGEVTVADVDGDGYLDMTVGANQIGGGSMKDGRPLSRFYMYRPSGDSTYEHGHFEDIGGSSLVPGFGGIDPTVCKPGVDKNGMGVAMRDLDDDGYLDLVQLAHNDMTRDDPGLTSITTPNDSCATGGNPFGIFVWQNQMGKAGQLGFRAIDPGPASLAEHGLMQYDPSRSYYTTISHAVGHEAVAFADVDNDGDLDVLTTGPNNPEWHVNSDPIMGRFFRNQGQLAFSIDTEAAGLSTLNDTLGQWQSFWGLPRTPAIVAGVPFEPLCTDTNKQPLCRGMALADTQLYPGMSVFADFDNDGWLDLLVTVRSDRLAGKVHNLVYMNRGDGTFERVSTDDSGMDGLSLAAQAIDLDGDGLLDLFLMTRKSGPNSPEQPSRVYMNTGHFRGRDARSNHWLNISLTGLPSEQLLGAKIYAHDTNGGLLGRQDYFIDVFRGSHDPMVHFGLGQHTAVKLRIVLPDRSERTFAALPVDATVSLNVTQ
jgi:hypothetical protein